MFRRTSSADTAREERGDGMSEQEFARVGLFVIAFGAYAFGTLFFSLAITHDIDDWSATFFLLGFLEQSYLR